MHISKYLITGGCGFLGSNLAASVLRRGDALTVFDNLSRSGSVENLSWLRRIGEFDFRHGDIRNAYDVEKVVSEVRPDVIFHLSGQVAMTTSLANPRMDFEVNALGTMLLLEAVRHHSPEATVVYSSTNKVYGDLEYFDFIEDETRYRIVGKPAGLNEATPLDFTSPYGCSKGAADQYMRDFHRAYGLKTVVFRHSSMYGARQFGTFDQGWISWFCKQAVLSKLDASREPFTIAGNGKQVRDVLEVRDMERLYFSAVQNIDRAAGEVFNIGGGEGNSLSLLELLSLLEGILGVRLNYRKIAPRYSDQKVFIADIEKAKILLNWYPEVGAEQGLREMVEWIAKIGKDNGESR